jgi:AcrR family transcriptional regulator
MTSPKAPNRRQVAALATRGVILQTARRLFTAEGYAATSIQRIAAEAGVSIQTIYSSVGSKPALVLALNDHIDEEAGLGQVAAALGTESRPERLVALGVRLTRQLNERCGDIVRLIIATAPAEPDVAAAYQDGLRRHRDGALAMARRLADMNALSPEMTAERAAAGFGMMTAPASWQQLTAVDGWTFDDAEDWIATSLTTLLLRRD